VLRIELVQGMRLAPRVQAAIDAGRLPRPEIVLLSERDDVQVTSLEDPTTRSGIGVRARIRAPGSAPFPGARPL
jgi:hypothetical protein